MPSCTGTWELLTLSAGGGTPRGREMLSEAGHLQLEEGVQSQAPLLRNSSSASQAHMGLNSTGTRYGLPLQTV